MNPSLDQLDKELFGAPLNKIPKPVSQSLDQLDKELFGAPLNKIPKPVQLSPDPNAFKWLQTPTSNFTSNIIPKNTQTTNLKLDNTETRLEDELKTNITDTYKQVEDKQKILSARKDIELSTTPSERKDILSNTLDSAVRLASITGTGLLKETAKLPFELNEAVGHIYDNVAGAVNEDYKQSQFTKGNKFFSDFIDNTTSQFRQNFGLKEDDTLGQVGESIGFALTFLGSGGIKGTKVLNASENIASKVYEFGKLLDKGEKTAKLFKQTGQVENLKKIGDFFKKTIDSDAKVFSALYETSVNSNQAYNDVLQETGDAKQASQAFTTTAVLNTAIKGVLSPDYFKQKGLLTDINKSKFVNFSNNIIPHLTKNFIKEGGEEALQQLTSNFTTNKPLLEGVKDSFILGGFISTIMTGLPSVFEVTSDKDFSQRRKELLETKKFVENKFVGNNKEAQKVLDKIEETMLDVEAVKNLISTQVQNGKDISEIENIVSPELDKKGYDEEEKRKIIDSAISNPVVQNTDIENTDIEENNNQEIQDENIIEDNNSEVLNKNEINNKISQELLKENEKYNIFPTVYSEILTQIKQNNSEDNIVKNILDNYSGFISNDNNVKLLINKGVRIRDFLNQKQKEIKVKKPVKEEIKQDNELTDNTEEFNNYIDKIEEQSYKYFGISSSLADKESSFYKNKEYKDFVFNISKIIENNSKILKQEYESKKTEYPENDKKRLIKTLTNYKIMLNGRLGREIKDKLSTKINDKEKILFLQASKKYISNFIDLQFIEELGLEVKSDKYNRYLERKSNKEEVKFKKEESEINKLTNQEAQIFIDSYASRLGIKKINTKFVNSILADSRSQAVGATFDNTIFLKNNPTKETIAHEMIHLIIKNKDTLPTLQNVDIEAVLKQAETQKQEGKDTEEYLAEEYEKYISETTPTKKKGILQTFFDYVKSILEDLKGLFVSKTKDINQIANIRDFFTELDKIYYTGEVVNLAQEYKNYDELIKDNVIDFSRIIDVDRNIKYKEETGTLASRTFGKERTAEIQTQKEVEEEFKTDLKQKGLSNIFKEVKDGKIPEGKVGIYIDELIKQYREQNDLTTASYLASLLDPKALASGRFIQSLNRFTDNSFTDLIQKREEVLREDFLKNNNLSREQLKDKITNNTNKEIVNIKNSKGDNIIEKIKQYKLSDFSQKDRLDLEEQIQDLINSFKDDTKGLVEEVANLIVKKRLGINLSKQEQETFNAFAKKFEEIKNSSVSDLIEKNKKIKEEIENKLKEKKDISFENKLQLEKMLNLYKNGNSLIKNFGISAEYIVLQELASQTINKNKYSNLFSLDTLIEITRLNFLSSISSAIGNVVGGFTQKYILNSLKNINDRLFKKEVSIFDETKNIKYDISGINKYVDENKRQEKLNSVRLLFKMADIDISRYEKINDVNRILGEKIQSYFDNPDILQGAGKLKSSLINIYKGWKNIVFKKLQSNPDVFFASSVYEERVAKGVANIINEIEKNKEIQIEEKQLKELANNLYDYSFMRNDVEKKLLEFNINSIVGKDIINSVNQIAEQARQEAVEVSFIQELPKVFDVLKTEKGKLFQALTNSVFVKFPLNFASFMASHIPISPITWYRLSQDIYRINKNNNIQGEMTEKEFTKSLIEKNKYIKDFSGRLTISAFITILSSIFYAITPQKDEEQSAIEKIENSNIVYIPTYSVLKGTDKELFKYVLSNNIPFDSIYFPQQKLVINSRIFGTIFKPVTYTSNLFYRQSVDNFNLKLNDENEYGILNKGYNLGANYLFTGWDFLDDIPVVNTIKDTGKSFKDETPVNSKGVNVGQLVLGLEKTFNTLITQKITPKIAQQSLKEINELVKTDNLDEVWKKSLDILGVGSLDPSILSNDDEEPIDIPNYQKATLLNAWGQKLFEIAIIGNNESEIEKYKEIGVNK